jgi:hypothetical protein
MLGELLPLFYLFSLEKMVGLSKKCGMPWETFKMVLRITRVLENAAEGDMMRYPSDTK